MTKQELQTIIESLYKSLDRYDQNRDNCLSQIRQYESQLDKLMKEEHGQKQLLLE